MMAINHDKSHFNNQSQSSCLDQLFKKRYLVGFALLCIQVPVLYFFYTSKLSQYWMQKNALSPQQEVDSYYTAQVIRTSASNILCSNETCLLKNQTSLATSISIQENGSILGETIATQDNAKKAADGKFHNKHGVISSIITDKTNTTMDLANKFDPSSISNKANKEDNFQTSSPYHSNTSNLSLRNKTITVKNVTSNGMDVANNINISVNSNTSVIIRNTSIDGKLNTIVNSNNGFINDKATVTDYENQSAPFDNESIVLPLCPKEPPGLQGHVDVTFSNEPNSMSLLEEDNPLVTDGGHYKPPYCTARWKVAIIIPFRDREEHLSYFLQYMHPTLQRQQLEYRLYIINQYGKGKFNRAKLMNVGYAESIKDLDFDCFVFHDVDLILENDKALYTCPDNPRHLSVGVDKFNYKLPYSAIFGGVTELTKEQFNKANGYANSFWGWGGEDDDMYNRVRLSGYHISRYPVTVSRYKMISHKREKGNEDNPKRFDMIRKTGMTMKTDGINSLKYRVIVRENHRLYTNVTVDLFGPM